MTWDRVGGEGVVHTEIQQRPRQTRRPGHGWGQTAASETQRGFLLCKEIEKEETLVIIFCCCQTYSICLWDQWEQLQGIVFFPYAPLHWQQDSSSMWVMLPWLNSARTTPTRRRWPRASDSGKCRDLSGAGLAPDGSGYSDNHPLSQSMGCAAPLCREGLVRLLNKEVGHKVELQAQVTVIVHLFFREAFLLSTWLQQKSCRSGHGICQMQGKWE